MLARCWGWIVYQCWWLRVHAHGVRTKGPIGYLEFRKEWRRTVEEIDARERRRAARPRYVPGRVYH